jgi:hypothetical protein
LQARPLTRVDLDTPRFAGYSISMGFAGGVSMLVE